MKQEWKTIALGAGISLALYLLLPLLGGYLMLQEIIGEETMLIWTAVGAGLASAAGMMLAGYRHRTLPPALLALLLGPAVQLLAALLGLLAFSHGFVVGEGRWVLLPISYVCALVSGALVPSRKSRKRKTGAVLRRRRR